jgi:hypothetical protein
MVTVTWEFLATWVLPLATALLRHEKSRIFEVQWGIALALPRGLLSGGKMKAKSELASMGREHLTTRIGSDEERTGLKLGRRGRLIRAVAVLIPILLGSVAAKADIQYTVNRTVGIGSVTGTIVTDGTVGTLAASNFVDWNLLLNDGQSDFYTLTGPLSGNDSVVDVFMSDVTASTSQLDFNFSGVDGGFLLFQTNLFSGSTYYCASTASFACEQGESVVPQSIFSSGAIVDPEIGDQVIGVAGMAATTAPEPSDYILLPGALLMLGIVLRRRSIA